MTDKEIDHLLHQYNLRERPYKGDLYNKLQFEYLNSKTQAGRITVIGDLLNDYDETIRSNIWFFRNSDVVNNPFDRSIVLYYKNEPPNKQTIDEREFFLFYKVLSRMIECKYLESFNKIKVICRDSVPTYYEDLECEKYINEIGPKLFDIYCNIYSNTVYLTTSTANHHLYGSKAIVSRNVYEMKKTNKEESILFNYIFCPLDAYNNYVDGDEFIWEDGTRSTYRDRFNDLKENQLSIDATEKLNAFIKCVLALDSSPIKICQ